MTTLPPDLQALRGEVMTLHEVAEYARVHIRTVKRWIKKGKVRSINIGGHYRILRRDLDHALRNPHPTPTTLHQVHTRARARFGPDPADWAFQCPACEYVTTGREMTWILSQLPAATAAQYGHSADQMLGRHCPACGAHADEHGTITVPLAGRRHVRMFDLAPEEAS